MAIHEKIRLLRLAKGWTQEETANKLQMSANGYRSIERGKTDANLSRLKQIAEVFEMNLADLFNADYNFLNNSNVKLQTKTTSVIQTQNNYGSISACNGECLQLRLIKE